MLKMRTVSMALPLGLMMGGAAPAWAIALRVKRPSETRRKGYGSSAKR
jgi:hypothetical protein